VASTASAAGSVNGIKVIDSLTGHAAHVTVANPIVLVTATGANAATFTLAPGSSGFATFGPNAAGLVKGVWLYTLVNKRNRSAETNDTVLRLHARAWRVRGRDRGHGGAEHLVRHRAPGRIVRPTCATRRCWLRVISAASSLASG